ncbi:MAG: DNA-directed RNA polymerase subunit omega [Desulfobulbaceae bacterium]|jgi:DNA-directed RNA polymerase subunit omega|nr:DNA-directed RNA polymerase subunit omega [Desulfobulbaceae bacterium]
MARITVEDCLSRIGNANRFSLVHLGVARIKQHRKGQPYLAKGKNKETVMTLREIANGSVTFDNINTLGQPPVEEKEEDVTEVSEETAN